MSKECDTMKKNHDESKTSSPNRQHLTRGWIIGVLGVAMAAGVAAQGQVPMKAGSVGDKMNGVVTTPGGPLEGMGMKKPQNPVGAAGKESKADFEAYRSDLLSYYELRSRAELNMVACLKTKKTREEMTGCFDGLREDGLKIMQQRNKMATQEEKRIKARLGDAGANALAQKAAQNPTGERPVEMMKDDKKDKMKK